MAAKEFEAHRILLAASRPSFVLDRLPPLPVPGALASACAFFASGSIIADVPYDPQLYFFGEEISLAVRVWTHGYDLFHPNRLFVFHDWDRSKRPTHFSDHRDWGEANDRAFARVRHLLGTEQSEDPEVLVDIERYGLGKVRSLARALPALRTAASSRTRRPANSPDPRATWYAGGSPGRPRCASVFTPRRRPCT